MTFFEKFLFSVDFSTITPFFPKILPFSGLKHPLSCAKNASARRALPYSAKSVKPVPNAAREGD
ncbi:MAG: hypothetical protein IJS46_06275 [Kiritimatiellae bacterium]|nr:hypothetical protein [Kiritimatiellia bacterium]